MEKDMPPPFFERERYKGYEDEYHSSHVSGEGFFQFFNKKRLKLAIAFIAGIVGVFGNFYAVRDTLSKIRFDMVGDEFARNFYAFGLTGLMDLMIVMFHLMRIPLLTWVTTIAAISVALYANLNMIISNQEVKDLSNMLTVSSGTVSIMMSSLPIIILTYLTHLTISQYDYERDVRDRKRYQRRDTRDRDLDGKPISYSDFKVTKEEPAKVDIQPADIPKLFEKKKVQVDKANPKISSWI